MRKVLTNLLLLLAILLLFKQVLDWLVPPSGLESTVRYKNELLKKEPANLLFFGNSTVRRGIIPSIIDSINQSKGIKSYNYGIHSLAFPYTVEWAKKHLKEFPEVHTIVVELTGIGSKVLDLDVWWEQVKHTVDLRDDWNEETVLFRQFRTYLLDEYLSPLPNLESVVRKDKRTIFDDLYAGYVPYAKNFVKSERRKRPLDVANRTTLQAYNTQKLLAADPLEPSFQKTIDELWEICRQEKVKPVLLAPSIMMSGEEVRQFRSATRYARSKGMTVLLITHPDLMLDSHRFDIRHFNDEGARLYSEELGKVLNKVVR